MSRGPTRSTPGAEPAGGAARRLAYVPAVDGLRAFAVMAVITFHTRPLPLNIFSVGWVGVWLFFCISGFVITRSLLPDVDAGVPFKAALAKFWRNRARRILPLYLLVIALASLALLAAGQASYLRHLPALLTFTYNFYRMAPSYEHTEMFGHLWSLSVEQQFYLVYPLLVLTLRRPRALVSALLAAIAVAAVARWGVGDLFMRLYGDPELAGNAVYQFSLGHIDGFACGALLAAAERAGVIGRVLRWLIVASAVTVATVLAGILVYEPNFMAGLRSVFAANVYGPWQPVLVYGLLVLWSTTAIAIAIGPASLARRALEAPVLVYIGRISYGMYIFHFPMIWVRETYIRPLFPHFNGTLMFCIYMVILVAICHVSYNYFERAWLKKRPSVKAPDRSVAAEPIAALETSDRAS